jgi:hypothetical protein
MTIRVAFQDHLVVVSAHGVSTFDEVRAAFDAIVARPDLHLPARILFDTRHTDHAPPGEELGALAEYLGRRASWRDSRWAVVAHPNTCMFGACRAFCCHAEFEGLRVETFSDDAAARTWLLTPDSQSSE